MQPLLLANRLLQQIIDRKLLPVSKKGLLSSVAKLQTMKNNLLSSKTLLLSIAFFSLFAFLAVNMHARCSGITAPNTVEMLKENIEAGDHAAPQNLPLRSLTVVERVLEIAGRFLPVTH